MNPTRLTVPASLEGLTRIVAAFDAFAAATALPESVAQAAQVALDELLSNTVRAGYPSGETGHIEAAFSASDEALDIHLVDDGVAFDPLARADPDTEAPIEARPIGGLGIYFVKRLMDDVSYERVGRENHLRLRKRIIKGP